MLEISEHYIFVEYFLVVPGDCSSTTSSSSTGSVVDCEVNFL